MKKNKSLLKAAYDYDKLQHPPSQLYSIEGKDLLDNYKEGDLLYGTTNAREKYVDQLKINNKIENKETYIFADQYNNGILDPLFKDELGNTNHDLSTAFDNVFDRIVAKNTLSLDKKNVLLNHLLYLLADKDYTPLRDTPNSKNFDHKPEIRRACKAKIKDPTIRHIHFVLDSIKPEAALDKEEVYLYNSFTSSELRFLHKHWDEVKDKVSFYHDGTVVKAPWDCNLLFWYTHHKMKNPDSPQSLLEKQRISDEGLSKPAERLEISFTTPPRKEKTLTMVTSTTQKTNIRLFSALSNAVSVTPTDSNDSEQDITTFPDREQRKQLLGRLSPVVTSPTKKPDITQFSSLFTSAPVPPTDVHISEQDINAPQKKQKFEYSQ
jgi:hypothetical protein